MGNMSKHLGPIALSAALLGLVAGGVYAGSQAFAPVEQKPQVQLVQPAAETVTPSPTTTTATPSPTTTTVAPAPVESSKAPAPAPKVVQKKVTVAETPASEPSPTSTSSTPGPKFGTDPANGAPNPPPVKWNGQKPSPTSTN